MNGYLVAIKANGFGAVLQRAAARTFGLEAGEQYGIARIWQTLLQVMQDATAAGHATSRYDDARLFHLVDGLRRLDGARQVKFVHAQRVASAGAGAFELLKF